MSNLKFSGQLVCKMAALRLFLTACLAIALNFAIATLFAMMFVACSMGGSTEETSMGGSSEEPSFASLENISVRGLAMVSPRYESLDSSQMGLALSGMRNGSVVTLYELDSLSLDSTGVSFADTVDNADGRFDIQGVTLSSPYVWITAAEKEGLSMNAEFIHNPIGGLLRVSAFVDVRDSAPITVDVFSDLMAYRARVLMLIGNSFSEAMAQAKREIFEAFGIYGQSIDSLDMSSIDYYAMRSVFVGVMYSPYMDDEQDTLTSAGVSKSFEQTGSFKRMKDVVLGGANEFVNALRFRLSIPQGIYDQMGALTSKEYQAMLLYEKYLAGMLSVIVDAGQCSAEKEGTSIEIPERDIFHHSEIGYSIVCRSGNWHLAYEQVPHTFGSMTDTRDGKTYKTVTIDLDGKTQTWMAENLNYGGAEFGSAKCIKDKPENCNIYGRLYDWNVAMGLGESVLRGFFDSRQECLDSISKNYSLKPIVYDSAFVEECIAAKAIDYYEDGNAVYDSSIVKECMIYGGAIPFDYDSLRVAYDLEIQEKCDIAMSDSVRVVDFSLINLDSLERTQGVCPDGWRIPTMDEWEEIFQYVDRKWRSNIEATYLLTAPSIGDPFGFGLYNTVDMEWDGDRSLQIERLAGRYVMVPKDNGAYSYNGYTGTSKTMKALAMGYVFYYEVVGFEHMHKDFFVRCIKD